MLVLHGAAIEERFFAWAEGSREGDGEVGKRAGRKRKAGPESLPFDAGADRLAAALGEAGLDSAAIAKSAGTTVAWLPTQGDSPLASSLLTADAPTSRAKPVVAPWTITAVELGAEQVVTLLLAAMGKPTLAPGIVIGQDLVFWTHALRLAGAVVARQQFLPGMAVKDGVWRACWEPVFAGEDANRPTELARQMPPVARAVGRVSNLPTVSSPPDTPALSVLAAFLTRTVDHLVRSTAAEGLTASPLRRGKAKRRDFDSVHDQWLYALRSDDDVMEGSPAELQQFAAGLRQWRGPIALGAAAPARLCFRLEEPQMEAPEADGRAPPGPRGVVAGGPWHVRYLLQARDDPSLLVPVEDAWETRGQKAALLKRPGFKVQEYLLSALGQASGLCPRIEASLKAARPAGYETDSTGAYEFLTERAMALEQAGFGVLLPAWWSRKGTKLRLSVKANVKSPAMKGAAGLSLDQLVHFDWQVALGDQTLSLQDLEMLASLKQPLVRVRGQWVQLSAEEIRAALDYWKKNPTGEATVRQVVQMALGADGRQGGIAFDGVEARGWIGELLQELEGRAEFEELPPPEDFHGTLRPYQVRGYSWLAFLRQWGLGACLADDMGLGKTVQTLALIERDWIACGAGVPPAAAPAAFVPPAQRAQPERLRQKGNGRRPVLLICPTSVVGNWQKEAARFTPDLPVMVHHGVTRAKHAAFKKAVADKAMVISSYGLLHRDIEYLQQTPWAGVILDEAQNIKNPETRQARAARSLKADYRVALTGTPVENHVGDLWSIMEYLNPGLLGTQAEFKREFYVPIQAARDPEAAERLKRLTGPFLLRRLKTDKSIISDLPEKLEMKVFCTLTKEQASLYTAVLKEAEEAVKGAEGIRRKGMILGMLSKLKQVCNHPAHFLGDNSPVPGRSGKLARLTEMLDEALQVDDRALIFSQFTEMGGILQRYLEDTFGREVLFLHGGVAKRQRDAMVERFQTEQGPPLLVLSLKAGGTGLNLTRANRVFHFDRWWNPAVENQATDRAFRIGQRRNVQVHKFLCAGTFEERIDQMIESKKDIAEKVIGAGEGWLTELSNQQLRDVFALSKEAVEA